MRNLGLASAAMLVPLLAGCQAHVNLNAPAGARPPNEHELFYTAVAENFVDADLCKKISAKALEENGPDLGSLEWRVYQQRSACYFYAALKSKNAQLCDSVRRIATLPSNASFISRANCREIIEKKNGQFGFGPATYFRDLDKLLKEVGYTDQDRYAAEYSEYSVNDSVHRFYQSVKGSEAFKSKIAGLPSYDETFSPDKIRPANGDEILAEIVAIDDARPALCGKISSNAYLEVARAAGQRGKMALRNNCFFSIAQNTRQAAPCRKIPPIDSGAAPPEFVNQERCEAKVKVLASHRDMDKYHYGPRGFSEMAQFVGELQKLGYADPMLVDEGAMDWQEFYRYMELQAKPELKRDFVRRVEALPTFTN
jgi:hypothetical protein